MKEKTYYNYFSVVFAFRMTSDEFDCLFIEYELNKFDSLFIEYELNKGVQLYLIGLISIIFTISINVYQVYLQLVSMLICA